MMRLGS